MKVKNNFELKNVLDEHIVLPKGSEMKEFEGAVVLSEVSAFAWEKLQQDISREELICAILEEFDVSEEQVSSDVDDFIAKLNEFGVLES